jgi:hypothetical protein
MFDSIVELASEDLPTCARCVKAPMGEGCVTVVKRD